MSEISDPHLRDDVLASYLDQALSAPARAAADEHLAECAACRDELVALSALARTTTRRPRAVRIAAPIAAIAAAVLIAVLTPWRGGTPRGGLDRERLRETTTVADGRVRTVAPVDGATIGSDSARFTWRRESADAGYHFAVTDDSGSVQWAFDTSDTTVILPGTVHLAPGRVYYWYVDALSGDGRTRATGLQRFRIAP